MPPQNLFLHPSRAACWLAESRWYSRNVGGFLQDIEPRFHQARQHGFAYHPKAIYRKQLQKQLGQQPAGDFYTSFTLRISGRITLWISDRHAGSPNRTSDIGPIPFAYR